MASQNRPSTVQRSDDLVWRLGDRCVLVRRVSDAATDDGATLVGTAATVWVAAEHPTPPEQLAAELDLSVADVDAAIDLLVAGEWLTAGA